MNLKYLCCIVACVLLTGVVHAQKKKEKLKTKLSKYYNLENVDFKHQVPGSVDFAFGDGFQITSKDSTSRLKISFRFQTLFTASKNLSSEDKVATNFLVRRARLKFDGFAFTPNLVYKVELGLSNRDMNPTSDFDEVSGAPKIILDAALKWKFHKNLTLWMGQTKLPGNRERVISSQKLQFVDRSILNSKFNLDRDIGLQLHAEFLVHKALLRFIAAWSMGEGRDITVGNIGGFGYTGRFEFLPMGKFSSSGDYFSADLSREQKPKLSLGFTYDFNNNASRVGGRLGNFLEDSDGNYFHSNLTSIFGDMMFKYNGFSILAEVARKKSSTKNVGFASGTAVSAQMGYLINVPKFKNVEFALRYSKINPDSGSSLKETAEYTFGISKYIKKHNLKVQSDVSLQDVSGSDNFKFIYRLQTEFAF
jgi:phosphate-selective porin OprO and OprP